MIVTRPINTNYSSLDRHLSLQPLNRALKAGQFIDAVVVSSSHPGQVNLRIGDRVIAAATTVALKQNAHLLLEVVQTKPQLLLRLIPSTADTPAGKPLQQAMITLLPQQLGLAPSLAGLIHKSLIESRSPAQAQLRSLINALADAIPGRDTLSRAEGLRQAIQQSGLFLEGLLARSRVRSRADMSRDIKACLIRTQHGLGRYLADNGSVPDSRAALSHLHDSTSPPRNRALPAPQHRVPLGLSAGDSGIDGIIPELLNNAKAAVARLVLLQVVTAENFNNGELMWQLEVPVKHGDGIEVVSMTVEKERGDQPSDESSRWVINLALDLPRLGPVTIRMSWFKQGISTCIFSDSASTRSTIEHELDTLRSKLAQHGVDSLNLCCQQGTPAAVKSSGTSKPNIDLQV